ncbi:SGNH/GDSL hydrolase family protein [Vibrio cholerae]|uniref:SGNH/GDSL hydrolase family protein n=1 Tax=Vibrio cholerae TaxID=666 RepID=A0A7Z7YDD7_VIBCL|nr:SGNH/GDSL hydrolase family protein [Vibrio cholerae]TBM39804.1 SGNH/GDSL hydrolase family protein [Vibrio cholerae]
MLTERQIIGKFHANEQLVVAVIGDSTSAGIAANSAPNTWTNGIAYAAVNQPSAYPNLDPASPYYVNADTYPSQAQQENKDIPTAVRKLWTALQAKNAESIVYNYSIPGWDAKGHISSNTVAQVASLVPKPQMAIVNLGINSAKNRQSQLNDLRRIVDQLLANGIFVLLAQPNNIGVAGSPAGSWSQTALPDEWYPQDYWPNTVNEIKTVYRERSTGFVNVGTDDLNLDITKLYDPFHPNEAGFEDIASKYLNWFHSGTASPSDGSQIKTVNGKKYYQPFNGNGAFKFLTSTGQKVSIPLTSVIDELRIKTFNGFVTFK